jgi:membrane protease subunit HflK
MNPPPPPQPDAHPGLDALTDALRRSFALLRGLMVVLALLYLASGIFILRQHEKAIVLRFGKPVGLGDARVLGPGLHWTWPKPFSEIIRVPAGRVDTLVSRAFWHRFDATDRSALPPTLAPLRDGYALSGDANLFHSEWAVRTTIGDPEAYLFGVSQPAGWLERELNRAVTRVAARSPVDGLIRTDLEGFRRQVEEELRARTDTLGLGLRIQGVDLLNLAPAPQVADAFDQVIRAEQEQAEETAAARAYAARVTSEAVGEADRMVAEGETEKTRLINRIKADADTFTRLQPAVARQPDLLRQIMWQDAIRTTLASAGQVYLVPADADGRREIRLQLSPRRENPFAEAMP